MRSITLWFFMVIWLIGCDTDLGEDIEGVDGGGAGSPGTSSGVGGAGGDGGTDGAGGGGAAGTGGSGGGGQASPEQWVNPECTDGRYGEILPPADADIQAQLDAYRSDADIDFLHDVLEIRYPWGASLVRRAQMTSQEDCVGFFFTPTNTASEVISQLSTIVHECGHFADLSAGDFSNSTYIISPELEIRCPDGETTERGGRTFARSRINRDEYSLPPCQGRIGGCDFYRDVYLDGDPDNQSFEGGDQGFDSLLEELLQYINSLAVGYAFHRELMMGQVSERDGILTFLWYLTRYLQMARIEYPDVYQILTNDCWRGAILTLWGRAWLYLGVTEGMPALGIDDEAILMRMSTAVLIEEIERLRMMDGCSP